MCGRYTLRSSPQVVADAFNLDEVPDIVPCYNITPTQLIPAVRQTKQHRELVMLRWGLIPSWSNDPGIGSKLINARIETVAEKPSFQSAFAKRRCLILADGFYEWKHGEKKQPYYIRMADNQPFAIAGLWDRWKDIESCTILTTESNDLVWPLHDRMPVILSPLDYLWWLDPEVEDPKQLQPLLRKYPHDAMTAYPVSTVVNNSKNDVPECIEPV